MWRDLLPFIITFPNPLEQPLPLISSLQPGFESRPPGRGFSALINTSYAHNVVFLGYLKCKMFALQKCQIWTFSNKQFYCSKVKNFVDFPINVGICTDICKVAHFHCSQQVEHFLYFKSSNSTDFILHITKVFAGMVRNFYFGGRIYQYKEYFSNN